MKPIQLLTTCFFAAATAFSVSGQTVDEVVALHMAAKGGAAMDSIRTAQIHFEMRNRDQPGFMTSSIIYRQGMKSFRMDTKSEILGMKISNIYCVTEKDSWLSFNENVKVTTNDDPADFHKQLRIFEILGVGDIYGILYQYRQKGYTVSLLNTDTLEKSRYYKVQTSIPPVSGTMIPFTTETHNRVGVTIYSYGDVLLNTPLEENTFKAPVKNTQPPSSTRFSVSVGGGLAGRSLKKRPRFEEISSEAGTVRVAVCVDREGDVIKAAYEKTGTTIDDAILLSSVEKNVSQWKFAALTGEQTQACGHVIFRFD
jgi:hypothetical protein